MGVGMVQNYFFPNINGIFIRLSIINLYKYLSA